MTNRIQKAAILKDLDKKMVLLVGPRQTGKTWLAREIAKAFKQSVYLNYDQLADRKIMLDQAWLGSTDLLVLDELHKMPDWKNYLKGVFDTKASHLRILVTGSARLNIFDQLGDSLAGRYYRHRLLPFSLAELRQVSYESNLERLLERGGFPEPFLADDLVEANRWRQQYVNSMLSSDVFEFDKVQNIKAMQLLFQLLRNRVGSPVSYHSLAEDLAVSPITVKKYIEILESLYVIFRVTPYSKNIARSLLKEPKIYFFDTALVAGNIGAQLENLVAVSLLKHCYGKVDYLAENYQLQYLRTKDGLEVDFVLVKDDIIEQMIEVKTSADQISKALFVFEKKYDLPGIQLVGSLRHEYQQGRIQVLKLEDYLPQLYV